MTVVKLILESIYEPTFSDASHGFRPNRSCHTALKAVVQPHGIRWWVEGDIKGFFDHVHHDTLLRILNKRITDKWFLYLIQQFLQAGYVEDWRFHQTYSGVPQGGNLSPLLSNLYLNELDQLMERRRMAFNKGTVRKERKEYHNAENQLHRAKKKARLTGDWTRYRVLKKKVLSIQPAEPLDPEYRRLYYTRYADDFLIGIIGSKAEAVELNILREELQLDLSVEKTLITHSKKRVRFLGYDIQRSDGKRIYRFPTKQGVKTQRTMSQYLQLLLPREKMLAFAAKYGNSTNWKGKHRPQLLNLSELEILMIYNAEIRGFLGYYALADNPHMLRVRSSG